MNKSLAVGLSAAFLFGACLAGTSFASEIKSAEKAVEEKGVKGCKSCGHEAMGEHAMKEADELKVVATSDGGIVIVTENSITKYDKDLKVVKEVSLKGKMEPMAHGMMGKKGPGCPMMKGMMKDAKDVKEAKEPAAVPVKK